MTSGRLGGGLTWRGAGVMGVNMEGEGTWEGEVGRENAVNGLTGGSMGD